MHGDILKETVDLIPKEEKPVETGEKSSVDAGNSGDSVEKSEKSGESSGESSVPPVPTPSNEELAKMWQPKTRQSIAQRLKGKIFVYIFVYILFTF